MLNNISLDHLFFLDIETVPSHRDYETLSPLMQELWLEKLTKIAPDSQDAPGEYAKRAGIYAEFGKIICISAGYFYSTGGQKKLRIKSFYSDDESVLLKDFLETVSQFTSRIPDLLLCGHNIREFDIPYICRRAVINNIALPAQLQLHGMKPWEVRLLDTLHLWRFGDHKNYTSLKLLAGILGIPTPKDDIDGSMVGNVYWQEHDFSRIVTYCQKDVLTVAQLLLRFKQFPLLTEEEIEIVS
jgi:uncharacterized protein YprB with RNaseH-like and TPR domain